MQPLARPLLAGWPAGHGQPNRALALQTLQQTNGDGPCMSCHNTGVGANTNARTGLFRDLVLDSLAYLHKDLGVDGFRFDLMGHHTRDNMLAVRAALDARRQWLVEQDLAEEGKRGIRLRQNALTVLQRRELLRFAVGLSD